MLYLLSNSQWCVVVLVPRCFPHIAKENERFQASFHGGSRLRRNRLPMLFYFLAQRSLINTMKQASLGTPLEVIPFRTWEEARLYVTTSFINPWWTHSRKRTRGRLQAQSQQPMKISNLFFVRLFPNETSVQANVSLYFPLTSAGAWSLWNQRGAKSHEKHPAQWWCLQRGDA